MCNSTVFPKNSKEKLGKYIQKHQFLVPWDPPPKQKWKKCFSDIFPGALQGLKLWSKKGKKLSVFLGILL